MCGEFHFFLLASCHTVDGRNPAPPKKPWNDDSPVNTNQPWFLIVSIWCEGISSIHSMICVLCLQRSAGLLPPRSAQDAQLTGPSLDDAYCELLFKDPQNHGQPPEAWEGGIDHFGACGQLGKGEGGLGGFVDLRAEPAKWAVSFWLFSF